MLSQGLTSYPALPPGFRFRPSDEELVGYFLKRKICKVPTPGINIPELDLYKKDPSDFAGMRTNYGTKDLYFFVDHTACRATPNGHWKCQNISRLTKERGGESPIPAVKSTFVYYEGPAPSGKLTTWVMDEFRYMEDNSEKLPSNYTLCRVRNAKTKGDKGHGHRAVGQRAASARKPETIFVPEDILETTSSKSMTSCVTVTPSPPDARGHAYAHGHGHGHNGRHGHKKGHGSAGSHFGGYHRNHHHAVEGCGDTSMEDVVMYEREDDKIEVDKGRKEGKGGKRGHKGMAKHFEKEGSPGKRVRNDQSPMISR